jgi:RNA-directed DNA polymerase
MSKLEKLKAAATLHDVAHLLGFKPKSLAYILYKKPDADKYTQFEIPKRTGGVRVISAPYPELKNLQRRLSELLQDCVAEINKARKTESTLSHGFRRKHSIITNAAVHRHRRYVLNIDLENFFGTINFGRVRGFLITNRNFGLNPTVATVLAQIACHDNALPQGSPCSPVVSNLIGHLLDIRLAALAYQTGCAYSRYADDITFSTNKRSFPAKLAKPVERKEHQWQVGSGLSRTIEETGFTINQAKTRMQYSESRQEVTGLIVNAKVNTRAEYRHTARAMVNRLLATGGFQKKITTRDDTGTTVVTEVNGTLDQLNGILSFIDSVEIFNKKKDMSPSEREKPLKKSSHPSCQENDYKRFLFFRHFFAGSQPLIVCEGKTDNTYLRGAIRRLGISYPRLAEVDSKGVVKFKVAMFRRTVTTDRLLGLNGGSDQLSTLIKEYLAVSKRVAVPATVQPVILLIDNDSGAKNVYNCVKGLMASTPDPSAPFIAINANFYIVPTPLTPSGQGTMIEDFFEDSVKKTILNGKTFNPDEKSFDPKTQYGKAFFASHVVKRSVDKIDFSGFVPILDRLDAAIAEHSKTP